MHEGGKGGEGKKRGVRRRSRAARRIVNVGAGDTRISSTRQRKSRRFYLWGGTGDVSHWRDDESVRLCTRLNLHSRGKLSLSPPFCPLERLPPLDVPRIYSGSARSIALLSRKFRPRRRGKSPPDTILLSRWLSARRVFSVLDPLDSRWSQAPMCFRAPEYLNRHWIKRNLSWNDWMSFWNEPSHFWIVFFRCCTRCKFDTCFEMEWLIVQIMTCFELRRIVK